MSIEATIQTALGALVGGRCYPLVAPDPVVKPYIVYGVVTDVDENLIDDNNTGLSHARYQIDVYTTSYGATKALGGKNGTIKAAWIAAFPRSVRLSYRELYEADTQLYRITMDFSVWS